MVDLLIRTQPAQDLILDKLTKMGIFKTRSEAIRAGIMGLNKEYNLFKNAQDIEDELVVKKMLKIQEEDKRGKRNYVTLREFQKKHGLK